MPIINRHGNKQLGISNNKQNEPTTTTAATKTKGKH
jgi:hypothetical protein